MSSEHSPTQHSANPKKTLPWCTNSTSGPYSHRPTHNCNRTQKQHTYRNYGSPKIERFELRPVAHKHSHPHLHRETLVLPLTLHMLMRGIHIYTSADCPTHPLHHLQSAPARTQRPRPPRTAVSKLLNRNSFFSSYTRDITPHTHTHYLHQRNIRHLSCKHHTRQHAPTHKQTSRTTPPK